MTRRTIETPFTYMITPGRLTAATYGMGRDALADLIGDLARQGLGAVQIREKALPASLQYDLAVRVRRAISGSRALCFVNERFDIAAAAGVDGVHLTSRSIPPDAVRRAVGPDFLVAVSTHGPEEISKAASAGADLAVFGPVFRTPGKGDPAGLGSLEAAVAAAGKMPVAALGGIDRKNYSSALASGAAGIAAIRLFEDRSEAFEVIKSVSDRSSEGIEK